MMFLSCLSNVHALSPNLFYTSGVPNSPSNVNAQLINQGKDMLIAWSSNDTPLQPVTQYVVEVEGQRQVAKRQTSLHDDDVHRYVTTDTKVLVQDIKNEMEYSIQVCAENNIGRTCVEPLTIKTDAREPPKISGILVDLEGDDLPVWVYVVAGLGFLVIVTVLLCLLVSCICCYRVKRMSSYYPSKQGEK